MGDSPVAAGPRPRVLVVDDEPNIVNLVRMSLRFHGFDVVTAASGGEALRAVAATRPDLIVLDVMLPDTDGFEVCRRLRARPDTDVPVIFLTARHGPADKVTGLTYGGDDYVTKPFSVDELVARVRAVLRRAHRGAPGPAHVLTIGDVVLDEDTHAVTRAGVPLDLSPTEFKLLRYLLINPRRVLSRAQILDAVWTYDFSGGDTVVDQYVSYLRRKLAAHGPPLITTHRGFGYMLAPPDRSA